ncbi:MAG: hypothetical protein M3Q68_08265, partial [Actinomycetota bacterium]|nr:hypothetical protein [Actinomycetota bacterium]
RVPIAIPMSLRADGPASNRVCVFVHGLMATDDRWRFRDDRSTTYGSLLARDRGVTPVYASYNSGRRIAVNGAELAERLDVMVRTWPVPITELSLVGHSMGGLVARSALHHGVVADQGWTTVACRLVLLGVPNHGSGLAHAGHALEVALSSMGVSAARRVGDLVGRRSEGLKDLRYGTVADGLGPDAPARLPEGLDVFVGAASAFGDGEHPVTRVLGDLLVSRRSAHGQLCENDRVVVFPSTGHVSLAANPIVYAQLLTWWDAPPSSSAGPPPPPAPLDTA